MLDAAVRDLLDQVQSDPAILAVLLFGSQARREATAGSDVDVCLILAPGHSGRDDQLRARLTYLPTGTLDIRVFQQLPLYVRRRVLREGKILSCREIGRAHV